MSLSNRILALDFGTQRIGVAISDPLQILAQGIGAIENSSTTIERLKRIIKEYDPAKIIVGMPYNRKGEHGPKANEVEKFIAQIEKELNIVVVRQDESFTSKIAHQTLLDMGVKKKKRRIKETVDSMAAALILQRYLDNQ